MTTFTDALGVAILPTDRVMVTAWGGNARLADTGIKRDVVRFARTRVVILDADNCERAFSPTYLSVLRRDGATGFEGNR